MRELAVVLASGGMDSCVCAAVASTNHDLAMLHVGYGQRTQQREQKAFDDIADFFKAKRRMITSLDHLQHIGGSSLTDREMEVGEADLEQRGIPTSYVPFRNAHLLAIATSWAEVLGAARIFFGAVEEDSSGYPDCRKEFVDAYNRMIELGTKPETRIQVETPLIDLSKAEIVRLGMRHGAPLGLSWSCYRAMEKACGHCDSCALRLRGFARAGFPDPIPYEDDRWRERYL